MSLRVRAVLEGDRVIIIATKNI
uniref:Uncharacterized protein n=1 Tax=Rhizophora mucronata TaxID=61149 RepID=A0A2P2PU17_RHIMU